MTAERGTSEQFDYQDENGSWHVAACPTCGAATDEPCAETCPTTGHDAAVGVCAACGQPITRVFGDDWRDGEGRSLCGPTGLVLHAPDEEVH